MRVVGMYSFHHAKEAIKQQHYQELEEVLQVIEVVDAEQHKSEVSKGKTTRDRMLYVPQALKNVLDPSLLIKVG